MTQWDSFIRDAEEHLRTLGWAEDNVDVYEPSITPVAGEGFTVDYPGSPSTSVTASISPATAASSRDVSGAESDVDVVIHVPSDAGPQWVGYGESGVGDVDARAICELPDGFRGYVTDYEPQEDGLDRLELTEADR
jgi:hypothetical protein